MEYLFGEKKLAHNDSYLPFVTPHNVSETVIQQAQEHFDFSDKIVWDMFAGIGTDAIKFADIANKVYCTEINPETYHNLLENTKGHENIITYNGNCLDYLSDIKANIIYFDPPWGSTFKSGQNFDFNDVKINDLTIPQLAIKLRNHAHLIIKAPIPSNSFEEALGTDIDVFTFTKQKLNFHFCGGLAVPRDPLLNGAS